MSPFERPVGRSIDTGCPQRSSRSRRGGEGLIHHRFLWPRSHRKRVATTRRRGMTRTFAPGCVWSAEGGPHGATCRRAAAGPRARCTTPRSFGRGLGRFRWPRRRCAPRPRGLEHRRSWPGTGRRPASRCGAGSLLRSSVVRGGAGRRQRPGRLLGFYRGCALMDAVRRRPVSRKPLVTSPESCGDGEVDASPREQR